MTFPSVLVATHIVLWLPIKEEGIQMAFEICQMLHLYFLECLGRCVRERVRVHVCVCVCVLGREGEREFECN